MEEGYFHVIPKSPTAKDYFIRLKAALFNQPDPIFLNKQLVRQMYKYVYPKAKV